MYYYYHTIPLVFRRIVWQSRSGFLYLWVMGSRFLTLTFPVVLDVHRKHLGAMLTPLWFILCKSNPFPHKAITMQLTALSDCFDFGILKSVMDFVLGNGEVNMKVFARYLTSDTLGKQTIRTLDPVFSNDPTNLNECVLCEPSSIVTNGKTQIFVGVDKLLWQFWY